MIESTPRESTNRRVPFPALLGALAVADALVIVAFIGYGLTNHAIEPWAYPVRTVRTALPFVVGWLVVAPALGAFRRRTLSSFGRTAAVTAVAWGLAVVVGGAIRSTSAFPGGAPPEFVLVIAGFGLGFVLPWRLAVTAVRRRRRTHRQRRHIGDAPARNRSD